MAESKEPVEELDLDEELEREASGAGNTPQEDGPGDLLQEEQQGSDVEEGHDESGDMDLGELEAFLDDFNRSIDDDKPYEAASAPEEVAADANGLVEEDPAELVMSRAEAEMMEAAAEDPGASFGGGKSAGEPEGESGMSDAEAEMMAAAAEDPGAAINEVPEPNAAVSDPEQERENPDSGTDLFESPEMASDWAGADESPAAELAEDELDLSFGEPQHETEARDETVDEFEELDLDAFDSESPETPAQPQALHSSHPSQEAVSGNGPPNDFEAMDAGANKPADSHKSAEVVEQTALAHPEAAKPESSGAGRMAVVAGVLAGLGLLTAGAAGYMAFELSSEVERLNRSVEAFRTSGTGASGSNRELGERVDQALRETNKLSARLSELAIIIEGPMSHLRESNERDVKNLSLRLDQLESSLQGVRQQTAALAAAPRAAKAAPVASSGWSINLISFSSRRSAEQEQQQLQKRGIDTVLRAARVDGRTWYRLQVGGFDSKAEAEAYLSRVKSIDGLDSAWVTN